MKQPQPIDPDELVAYVDGELDARRRRDIEQLARQDAALARRIQALREQTLKLRQAFDPMLDEAVPARLLRAARSRRPPWAQAAMLAGALALGAAAGSLATRLAPAPSTLLAQVAPDPVGHFVRQAQLAYSVYTPDPKRPVEVRQRSALVTWLSRRMGRDIAAPQQLPYGLQLIGGRLLPGAPRHPAALLMYQDARGRRVTVYLRAMADPTATTEFRIVAEGSVTTLYWIDRDWGYALSGELPRAQLLRVSRALYRCYSGSCAG